MGSERGGPGVRFRRVGRENLIVAPARARRGAGGRRRVGSRVDLPRMIDAMASASRAGSTGAYLAFRSVERPPLAGADILPLYCREVSSGEASRATSSDFAVGGATSTEIARRPSDVVRARRGGSRATLKARGVKLALARRLVDVKALAPRRSPDCLPIRRCSLAIDISVSTVHDLSSVQGTETISIWTHVRSDVECGEVRGRGSSGGRAQQCAPRYMRSSWKRWA